MLLEIHFTLEAFALCLQPAKMPPSVVCRRDHCQVCSLKLSIFFRVWKVKSFMGELKVNGVLTPDAAVSYRSIEAVCIIHQARLLARSPGWNKKKKKETQKALICFIPVYSDCWGTVLIFFWQQIKLLSCLMNSESMWIIKTCWKINFILEKKKKIDAPLP